MNIALQIPLIIFFIFHIRSFYYITSHNTVKCINIFMYVYASYIVSKPLYSVYKRNDAISFGEICDFCEYPSTYIHFSDANIH